MDTHLNEQAERQLAPSFEHPEPLDEHQGEWGREQEDVHLDTKSQAATKSAINK